MEQVERCKNIFVKKNHDYGTAWRILRGTSLTDQIFIKAQRIRSIEEAGSSKVNEGIDSEFIGIVNYAIIALINLELNSDEEISNAELVDAYNKHVNDTLNLDAK